MLKEEVVKVMICSDRWLGCLHGMQVEACSRQQMVETEMTLPPIAMQNLLWWALLVSCLTWSNKEVLVQKTSCLTNRALEAKRNHLCSKSLEFRISRSQHSPLTLQSVEYHQLFSVQPFHCTIQVMLTACWCACWGWTGHGDRQVWDLGWSS